MTLNGLIIVPISIRRADTRPLRVAARSVAQAQPACFRNGQAQQPLVIRCLISACKQCQPVHIWRISQHRRYFPCKSSRRENTHITAVTLHRSEHREPCSRTRLKRNFDVSEAGAAFARVCTATNGICTEAAVSPSLRQEPVSASPKARPATGPYLYHQRRCIRLPHRQRGPFFGNSIFLVNGYSSLSPTSVSCTSGTCTVANLNNYVAGNTLRFETGFSPACLSATTQTVSATALSLQSFQVTGTGCGTTSGAGGLIFQKAARFPAHRTSAPWLTRETLRGREQRCLRGRESRLPACRKLPLTRSSPRVCRAASSR